MCLVLAVGITEPCDAPHAHTVIRYASEMIRLHMSSGRSRIAGPPPRESIDLEHALTARQRVIIDLVAQARTNAAIAAHIGFSESLVRQELMTIFRILGVNSRGEVESAMVERWGAERPA